MTVLEVLLDIVLCLLALLLAMVLLWALASIFYSFTVRKKVYKKSYGFARFLAAVTCWGACFFTRTHIRIEGRELIPKDGRFAYVANHRSRFDPMVILYKFPRSRIAFISKPGNFRIPFFGKMIRKMCFLEIDRDDPHKAMETVNNAVDILRSGEASIGFYPEGTRSKTGKLGEFHNFMFRIPVNAQVPVVVAVTRGTEDIAKRFPFPGGARVTIKIIGVIDEDYVRTHRPVEIGQKVEAMIREELGE